MTRRRLQLVMAGTKPRSRKRAAPEAPPTDRYLVWDIPQTVGGIGAAGSRVVQTRDGTFVVVTTLSVSQEEIDRLVDAGKLIPANMRLVEPA